jgi:hypothetical protein
LVKDQGFDGPLSKEGFFLPSGYIFIAVVYQYKIDKNEKYNYENNKKDDAGPGNDQQFAIRLPEGAEQPGECKCKCATSCENLFNGSPDTHL